LPEGVRLAIIDMIETGADFISAAKSNGLQPQTMRRWLGRAECISFLRQERARFRQSVCAQNEAVLAEIRDDREGNQMARVHAVRALERLDEQETMRRPGDMQTPGVTIRIVNVVPQPAPIDITPRSPQIIDGSQ
jgi:DNA-binding SARP family transcriptional activator